MYLSSTTAFQKRLGRTGGEDELWDQMIFSFIEKVPHPTWWDEWCLISFRMHPDPNLTCRPILWSKSRMVFSVPVRFLHLWLMCLSPPIHRPEPPPGMEAVTTLALLWRARFFLGFSSSLGQHKRHPEFPVVTRVLAQGSPIFHCSCEGKLGIALEWLQGQ